METFKQSGLYTGKLPDGNKRFSNSEKIFINQYQ